MCAFGGSAAPSMSANSMTTMELTIDDLLESTRAVGVDDGQRLAVNEFQIAQLNGVAAKVHVCALEHGWWDAERNDGEALALMHSELSEALEAIREGNPPDRHVPELPSLAIEMADVVIRVFDYCAGRGIDIGRAIAAKHRVNINRPYKHGKTF